MAPTDTSAGGGDAPAWAIAEGIPRMTSRRYGFDSVFFQGQWIVIGGCNHNGKMSLVERIHVSDAAVASEEGWQELPRLRAPRHGFGSATVACRAPEGATDAVAPHGLLVAGGHGPLNTVELLNLASPQHGWKPLPHMTHQRYGCAVASLAPETTLPPNPDPTAALVFVVGGSDHGIFHDTVEYLDAADALRPAAAADRADQRPYSWRTLPARMSMGRTFCAAVLMRPRRNANAAVVAPSPLRLVVMGGRDGTGSSTASVESFDFLSRRWQQLPPMKVARSQFAAVVVGDRIYAVGGMSPSSPSGKRETTLSSVEFFDFSSTEEAEWTLLPEQMTTGRRGCAAIVVGGTHLVVSGGQDAQSLHLDSVEVYPLPQSCPQNSSAPSSSSSLPELPPVPTETGREARANALHQWCGRAEQILVQAEERKNAQGLSIQARYEAEIREAQERFDRESQRAKEKKERELARLALQEGHEIREMEKTLNLVREELDALNRASRDDSSWSSLEPPQHLLCPITQVLMIDPVTAKDGHTYERSAIENWFRNFPEDVDPNSPLTNLPLPSRELTPVMVLKSLCNEYRAKKSSR